MLNRIRSSLCLCLAAVALGACQGVTLAGTTPASSAPAEVSHTPAPAFSAAPFSDSLLVAAVNNSTNGTAIYPLDPLTGKPLQGYEPIRVGNYFYAFAPDMQTLAVINFARYDVTVNGQLHLVDLRAWRDQVFDLKLNGWINSLRFSPDGAHLAIAYGDSANNLLVFDTKNGTVLAEGEVGILVHLMQFTTDGGRLMLYGPPQQRHTQLSAGAPQAILLNAANLGLEWTVELQGLQHGLFPKGESMDDLHAPGQAWYFTPAIAFAPDRDVLYIVHANEEKLTTVDFAARSLRAVEIRPKLSWFEHWLMLGAGVAHAKIMDGTEKNMVVSPDGRRLYVVGIDSASTQLKDGTWDVKRTPLGLQVIDAEDGSQIGHYETEATNLAISPDGRRLYLRGWDESATTFAPWTAIFDTVSGEQTAALPALDLMPTKTMGGRPILVSERPLSELEYELAAFDLESLALFNKFYVTRYGSWLRP